uniref:Uncharacterized protein n=1 Tax=Romanomermis culicivorax TaxID=13658 RepID=A0A915JL07_ROMCU
MDIQELMVEKERIAPTTKDTLQIKEEMQKLMNQFSEWANQGENEFKERVLKMLGKTITSSI